MDDDEGNGGTRIAADDTRRGTLTTQIQRTGGGGGVVKWLTTTQGNLSRRFDDFHTVLLAERRWDVHEEEIDDEENVRRQEGEKCVHENSWGCRDRDFPRLLTAAIGQITKCGRFRRAQKICPDQGSRSSTHRVRRIKNQEGMCPNQG